MLYSLLPTPHAAVARKTASGSAVTISASSRRFSVWILVRIAYPSLLLFVSAYSPRGRRQDHNRRQGQDDRRNHSSLQPLHHRPHRLSLLSVIALGRGPRRPKPGTRSSARPGRSSEILVASASGFSSASLVSPSPKLLIVSRFPPWLGGDRITDRVIPPAPPRRYSEPGSPEPPRGAPPGARRQGPSLAPARRPRG